MNIDWYRLKLSYLSSGFWLVLSASSVFGVGLEALLEEFLARIFLERSIEFGLRIPPLLLLLGLLLLLLMRIPPPPRRLFRLRLPPPPPPICCAWKDTAHNCVCDGDRSGAASPKNFSLFWIKPRPSVIMKRCERCSHAYVCVCGFYLGEEGRLLWFWQRLREDAFSLVETGTKFDFVEEMLSETHRSRPQSNCTAHTQMAWTRRVHRTKMKEKRIIVR